MTKTQTQHAAITPISSLLRDTGYRWVERDPALNDVCHTITQSGRSVQWISSRTKELSHNTCSLCPQTLNNWLSGRTKRPQNFLVDWTYRALDIDRIKLTHEDVLYLIKYLPNNQRNERIIVALKAAQ